MGMADMERELEKLMEEFRNEKLDEHGGFPEEIYKFLTQVALECAEGELTVSVTRKGEASLTKISGGGNSGGVLVACFNLIKMAITETKALSFEDIIKMLGCMKDQDPDLGKDRRGKR